MVVCSLVPCRAAQADSFYFRPCVGVLSETRMDNNSNPISAAHGPCGDVRGPQISEARSRTAVDSIHAMSWRLGVTVQMRDCPPTPPRRLLSSAVSSAARIISQQ